MRKKTIEAIYSAKEALDKLVSDLSQQSSLIGAVKGLSYDYRIENAVSGNRDLLFVPHGPLTSKGPEPRFILVGDNPGKNEQATVRYFDPKGSAGKGARREFASSPIALPSEFDQMVLTLNKTPIHTKTTADLQRLYKSEGPHRGQVEKLLSHSQERMAEIAWDLACGIEGATLWICGKGHLRKGKALQSFGARLRSLSEKRPALPIWVFSHFSHNAFRAELNRHFNGDTPTMEELAQLGAENRKELLGF